jgi:hypothetical protein
MWDELADRRENDEVGWYKHRLPDQVRDIELISFHSKILV